jgi:small subunit ribosomal protein S17
VVISNKMDKTITVAVEYLQKHPKYLKHVRRRTILKAHDPKDECAVGDRVILSETRPLSKTKRWRLVSIVKV